MVSEKKTRKNSAPSVPASPPKLSKDEVYNVSNVFALIY